MNAHTSALAIAHATPIALPADLLPTAADGSLVALTKEYAETYADLLGCNGQDGDPEYDAILAKLDTLHARIKSTRPTTIADAAAQLRWALAQSMELALFEGYRTGDMTFPAPEDLRPGIELNGEAERALHETLRYLEGLTKRDDELWALIDQWASLHLRYHMGEGLNDDQMREASRACDRAAERILDLPVTSVERALAKSWMELDARWFGGQDFILDIDDHEGTNYFEDQAARRLGADVQAAFPQFALLPGSTAQPAIPDPALAVFSEWCRRTVELESTPFPDSDVEFSAPVEAHDAWVAEACADEKIGTGPLGAAIASFFAAYLHCGRVDKVSRGITLDWTNPHTAYPDMTRDASERAFRIIIDGWPQLYDIAAAGGEIAKLSTEAVH